MAHNHKIHLECAPFNICVDSKGSRANCYKIIAAQLCSRMRFALDLLSAKEVYEVSLRFCSPSEMKALNHRYRKKNKVTDVLSFAPAHFPGQREGNTLPLGDILVCPQKCFEQMRLYKNTLIRELERVLIHGLVHLRGFDHEKSPAHDRTMLGLEMLILKEVRAKFGPPSWLLRTTDGAKR